MNARPELLSLVRQWIAKAEEDLRTAEHALKLRRKCPVGAVCFHSQQCVEKYLKALLTLHCITFPKTHDLQQLALHVPQQLGLSLAAKDLSVLNRYSVEARYPGDWEPITRSEAEQAVAMARAVRQVVRTRLPKRITRR